MKRIVLCGTTNAGKTTTLKKLIDILKCNGTAMPNQSSIADSNEVTDCRVVFKVKSAVVGVCTAGDKYDIVKDNEQFLKENRCDVGVEALRLNDKQWSLIKSFVCLFKGEVPLFIWKFPWTENQNVVRNYGITYAMRPLRNFKTNQCCHLISRIANRAFFLNDEEKTRFVERLWRVATFSWGLRGPRGVPVLERLRKEDAECYFIGGNVKCSEVRTYREFYDRFLARNNLTHIRFHALRHTFATRCIEAGGDCKTVSELLGHSTVNLTLNLYGHPQMAQKRQCVESLSY